MTATATEVNWTSVKEITWAWSTASSSSGATTGTTSYVYDGSLLGVAFVPGTAGAQPSASYDVTITPGRHTGVDLLLGAGANLSNAATVYKKTGSLAAVAHDTLTINVSGAGSSHSGTVILYVR